MQMQQQQGTTIAQKIEIGANIVYTIAFPVMVLLRRRLGYRFISQPRLIISALFFWIAAIFTVSPATPLASSNAFLLVLFALAFLIWGFVQRALRWRDIKQGVPWHSRSRGISWFAFLPLNDSSVKRFVDPAVVLVVGGLFALTGVQRLLGIYLMVAALCLFAFESYDYERSINMMLDQLDNLVDSEVMGENMEYYHGGPGQVKQRSLDETAGIPTGISPDLEVQIQRRRTRATAPPPDNMVTTAP
ncbi:hypothetical protein [Thermogemmatispora carboxidivorans]|uniref:hypothetical protein n=1 Tax=Thermogemmatispora carboxidivorans TaxID=1382306 RepID=UPI00069A8F05|nr:hypothetical protein [Thermogemmatispora carboxidivorans]